MDNEKQNFSEDENGSALKFKPNGPVKKKIIAGIFDLVEIIVMSFAAVVLIFTFVFKVASVRGPSMNDTLIEGQKIITTAMFYTPQRGDVVIIDSDKFSEPIIKRVIAVGGDTVDIDFENWTTTVTTKDGEIITYKDEEYVKREYDAFGNLKDMSYANPSKYPLHVGDDEIFVMGDNRNHSTDSREKGTFKVNEVIGKAAFTIWPFDRFGFVE